MTPDPKPNPRDLTRKNAEAAADWWCDRLRTPSRFDNGDPYTSGVANILLAAVKPRAISEEKIAIFRAAFVDAVIKFFYEEEFSEGRVRHDSTCYTGTDYHPQGELSDALTAAGITDHRGLPVKVGMNIHPFHVLLSNGYATPFKLLADFRPVKWRLAEAYRDLGDAVKALGAIELLGEESEGVTKAAVARFVAVQTRIVDMGDEFWGRSSD